jgi:mono/diheme cytochrome c family protein
MKALFLLFFVPAVAAAQNLTDILKQGEEVFNKTCANGYCHGAQGVGGGAPRLSARGFDQTFINNTVTRGVPNTAMQSFANTLSRGELTAVVAYVAILNGVANPVIPTDAPPPAAPSLSAEATRGRALFSDAVRSFGRCSTCHEVNGLGIPVAAPIATVPSSVAAFKALPTPRVSTVIVAGETLPAIVLSKKSSAVLFYDLTTPPPVLRTELPEAAQVRDGGSWRHSSVIGSYNDAELSAILAYLGEVLKN